MPGRVRASCSDSVSHGFLTPAVADAVGHRAPEPHQADLFGMSAKYADPCSADEAIAYTERCPVGITS